MGKPSLKKENFFLKPEMNIPDKYACTGDVNILADYLINNPIGSDGQPLSEEAKAYLEEKVENMEYINSEVRKMNNQKVQPKKAIKYGNDGLILDLSHQPQKQSTGCGCWAMPTVLMLQSRGIMIDQDVVKNYKPEISMNASENVLPEDKKMMNTDVYSNISFSAGLLHKFVPNSALSQIKYRKTNNPAQTAAATKHLNTKIREALQNGSPVSLLVGNHYRTIVGIEGDNVILKDSNTDTPDLNVKESLSNIVNDLPEGHTIELSHLKDLTVNKDNKIVPNELKKYESVLHPDGNGGYKAFTAEEINKGVKDRNDLLNIYKESLNNGQITQQDFDNLQMGVDQANSVSIMESPHTEDHIVLGSVEKVNVDGIDFEIGETLHVPKELNKDAKYIEWDPDEHSKEHWNEEIKNNPDLSKTLLNNETSEPLVQAEQVVLSTAKNIPDQVAIYKDNAEQKKSKKVPKRGDLVTLFGKDFDKSTEVSIVENSDGSFTFNGLKDNHIKPDVNNLNNPPLETGKSIDIDKFRELERNTVFDKSYDEMFKKESDYAKSLPEGPLKKMTEMSIDARNAIKVLSTDPTPQNKADMREYAKIIVAQKLLAIEHACNNGMGVTEKGLEEKGAKWFLSDSLVTKLTDQVIDFSKPDFMDQLDDFLTKDKGLEKIKDFAKQSVNNNSKFNVTQKNYLNNCIDNALDTEHNVDRLQNLYDRINALSPNMVSNKQGLDNLKNAVTNAINLRNEINNSTEKLDANGEVERSERLRKAYKDIQDTSKAYVKLNASGQTVNEKGEQVYDSKLTGAEVGIMYDAGNIAEDVIKNESVKTNKLNTVLEKEKRLVEYKAQQQHIADEKLGKIMGVDINLEKMKLSADFDVINRIRNYDSKLIPYQDRLIFVAGRFGKTLDPSSKQYFEQPNLVNVFDAQLCILGADPKLFGELVNTIPNGKNMSNRQLKAAFVDAVLNDPDYLKKPENTKFLEDTLKPEFEKARLQMQRKDYADMQDYMHETMKSISIASQTQPYTDMKATLINDCMNTAKNVISKAPDYRPLAATFVKDQKLTDQIHGAYNYNELRIRGNDAKNKILNNYVSGDKIDPDVLADYTAGQIAASMHDSEQKIENSLAKDKVQYNKTFEEFGKKNGQYSAIALKTMLKRSDTFIKLCQAKPEKIREAIMYGGDSFNKIGAQIVKDMMNIPKEEREKIINMSNQKVEFEQSQNQNQMSEMKKTNSNIAGLGEDPNKEKNNINVKM